MTDLKIGHLPNWQLLHHYSAGVSTDSRGSLCLPPALPVSGRRGRMRLDAHPLALLPRGPVPASWQGGRMRGRAAGGRERGAESGKRAARGREADKRGRHASLAEHVVWCAWRELKPWGRRWRIHSGAGANSAARPAPGTSAAGCVRGGGAGIADEGLGAGAGEAAPRAEWAPDGRHHPPLLLYLNGAGWTGFQR